MRFSAETIARYYKDGLKIIKKDVILVTESRLDNPFWQLLFNNFSPGLRTLCLAENRILNVSGVKDVWKFGEFMDKSLILCIDSDFHYLEQNPNYFNQDFVFQTYTHSRESYHCFSGSLAEVCSIASNTTVNVPFDFDQFFAKYSEAVFEPLCLFLISLQKQDGLFSRGENEYYYFTEMIKMSGAVDIRKSVEDLLNSHLGLFSNEEARSKLEEISLRYQNHEKDSMSQRLIRLGCTRQNAYLFVRGHTLLDSVAKPLMQSVVHILKANHYRALVNATQEERIAFESQFKKIEDLLNENMNFWQCPLIELVGEDITRFTHSL